MKILLSLIFLLFSSNLSGESFYSKSLEDILKKKSIVVDFINDDGSVVCNINEIYKQSKFISAQLLEFLNSEYKLNQYCVYQVFKGDIDEDSSDELVLHILYQGVGTGLDLESFLLIDFIENDFKIFELTKEYSEYERVKFLFPKESYKDIYEYISYELKSFPTLFIKGKNEYLIKKLRLYKILITDISLDEFQGLNYDERNLKKRQVLLDYLKLNPNYWFLSEDTYMHYKANFFDNSAEYGGENTIFCEYDMFILNLNGSISLEELNTEDVC